MNGCSSSSVIYFIITSCHNSFESVLTVEFLFNIVILT